MSKFLITERKWNFKLYSIVHVAMETKTTSHFTCQSKSFISIFFTSQVSSCELQLFSCHDLANSIYSQTAKLRSATLKVRKKVRELNWLRFHIWQELMTNLILSWADSHIYNRLLFHPNFQILEFFQWFSKIRGSELKTIIWYEQGVW